MSRLKRSRDSSADEGAARRKRARIVVDDDDDDGWMDTRSRRRARGVLSLSQPVTTGENRLVDTNRGKGNRTEEWDGRATKKKKQRKDATSARNAGKDGNGQDDAKEFSSFDIRRYMLVDQIDEYPSPPVNTEAKKRRLHTKSMTQGGEVISLLGETPPALSSTPPVVGDDDCVYLGQVASARTRSVNPALLPPQLSDPIVMDTSPVGRVKARSLSESAVNGATKRRSSRKVAGGGGGVSRTTVGDGAAWCDKYLPHSEAILAVHPNKVKELKQWLEDSIEGLRKCIPRTKKLLVLSGPPGSCKSTMLRMVLQNMGIEEISWSESTMVSWKDSTGATVASNDHRLEQLRQFVNRSKRYPAIALDNASKGLEHGTRGSEGIEFATPRQARQDKVLVMEDIPYLHDQAQARQFHDVVSSQLQSSSFPMVLVLTTSEDESTALPRGMYSLLPFEILHSPLVTLLKINPVAAGRGAKALSHICQQEGIEANVKHLGSLITTAEGDLRSAINALQFNASTGNSVVVTEANALLREGKRGIYRALGKVLHNKRTAGDGTERGEIAFDPDTLVSKTNIRASQYCRMLQHNYVKMFSDIDDVVTASSFLSDSDMLGKHEYGRWNYAERACEDYAVSIAIRGVMHANKHPQPSEYSSFRKSPDIEIRMRAETTAVNAKEVMFPATGVVLSCAWPHSTTGATSALLTEVCPYQANIALRKFQQFTPVQRHFLHRFRNFAQAQRGALINSTTALEVEPIPEDAVDASDARQSAEMAQIQRNLEVLRIDDITEF